LNMIACCINISIVNNLFHPHSNRYTTKCTIMKKFLLMALISGSAFAASAQQPFANHDNDRNRQPISNERGFDQRVNRQHELDNRIAAINNDYNDRINNLQHRPFMRARDKRRQIKQLEKERTVALQQCSDRYSRNYGAANRTHRF
jgi:hypothetical protein